MISVKKRMSSPLDLGLRHKDWRPGQLEAVEAIEGANTPVVIVEGPTGTGKTVMVLAVLRRALSKGFVLTPNISLQDQYLYEANGMAKKVIGRGNYLCPLPMLDEQETIERGVIAGETHVDMAPCASGFRCPYKNHCQYFIDKREALRSRISIHNYAYWLPESTYSRGFIGADWVVADEGHLLDGTNGILSKFGSITITNRVLQWAVKNNCAVGDLDQVEDWVELGRRGVAVARTEAAMCPLGTVARSKAEQMVQTMERLLGLEAEEGRWVIDYGSSYQQRTIRPVWPPNAEKVLLNGKGKRLMIVSATPGDPELFTKYLGIDNYTFIKLPWVFPPEIRPIYYRPVGAVTRANRDAVAPNLAKAIEGILAERVGEKGVIHTQSFDLLEAVMGYIKDTQRLIVHDRQTSRTAVIGAYKQDKGDSWLISPAVGHGEDFTMATAQIILKVPFPDLSDMVVRIRTKQNPTWYKWETGRELGQRIGRVARREDGYGETWILDSKFESVIDYLPEETREAIR